MQQLRATGNRLDRPRRRALRTLQVALVIAFALFVSVANASADEATDPNAPTEQQVVQDVAPAPAATPTPVVVPALAAEEPVADPAPAPAPDPVSAPDPAPAADPTPAADPAPASKSSVDESPAAAPVAKPLDRMVVAAAQNPKNQFKDASTVKVCHAQLLGGWTPTNSSYTDFFAFIVGHENHNDIWQSFDYYDSNRALKTKAAKNLGASYTRIVSIGGELVTFTYTGQQIYDAGCTWPSYAPDLCTNIGGYQPTVPAGNVSTGGICRKNELEGSDVTFCHAVWGWYDWNYEVRSYETRNGDLGELQSHAFWDSADVIPAYSYFDASGVLKQSAAKGNQQILDWGCSKTPPPPADVCANISDNQPSVPSGLQQVGANCVPPAVSCNSLDQSPLDDGSTLNSVANDGVDDACAPNPKSCDTGEGTDDVNHNGIVDTCLPVACKTLDEYGVDTGTNGVFDQCRTKPDIECTRTDEMPVDTNGNGALDTCVPKPDALCGLAVGVDSNGNGSKDLCVKITPIIDCGTYNADGTRTLFWRWRNSSSHAITVPVGPKNVFFAAAQPTEFAPGEGSFTTTLDGPGLFGLNAHTWVVTGNTAIGAWSARVTPRCFPDECPNLAGDQSLPKGYAFNRNHACVPQTTSCPAEYVLDDSDHDGVNDRCVANPISAEACGAKVPYDTNENGVADACASIQPQLACVTELDGGGWKAWFTWSNANAMPVTVPVGSHNSLAGGSAALPTTFAPGSGAAFAVVADEDSTSIAWTLTETVVTASLTSNHCFADSCANLTGDQQTVPEGLALNDLMSCVSPSPTCADSQVASDVDKDGVKDTCTTKSAAPADSEAPSDSSGTGGGDADDSDQSAAPDDADTAGDDVADDDDSDEVDASAAPGDASTEGVSAAETTVEEGSGLPYTGLGLGVLMLIGIGAIGSGVVSRRAARRRERRANVSA